MLLLPDPPASVKKKMSCLPKFFLGIVQFLFFPPRLIVLLVLVFRFSIMKLKHKIAPDIPKCRFLFLVILAKVFSPCIDVGKGVCRRQTGGAVARHPLPDFGRNLVEGCMGRKAIVISGKQLRENLEVEFTKQTIVVTVLTGAAAVTIGGETTHGAVKFVAIHPVMTPHMNSSSSQKKSHHQGHRSFLIVLVAKPIQFTL
jgi:hypothetical protein